VASESVPDDCKVANVVPVHKGGSRNVATSQVFKVYETIVMDQVIEFMESNELIKTPSTRSEKVVHI